MAISKITSGHGLSGSGLGHPENMGVSGPGGKFMGRTMPQDIKRNSSTNGQEVGEVGSKKVPGNIGIKQDRTGGMKRKFAGVVGPTKGSGTN